MRSLSIQECSVVSAASGAEIAALAAGLAGGYVASSVADVLSPFATVIGTVGSAAVFGLVCTFPAPVVGTILCGTAGALGGYALSATLFTAGAFVVGAGAAGFATFRALSS